MLIALGSDHAGFALKEELCELLKQHDYEFKDFGAFSEQSVDYPEKAIAVAKAVASGQFDRGILICGTGLGMCITANKVRGIRAALCSEHYSTRMSVEHNNANVLALGGRTLGVELAKELVLVWLAARFDPNSRHARRVDMMEPPTGQGG